MRGIVMYWIRSNSLTGRKEYLKLWCSKPHDQNLIWKNACSPPQGRILNMEGISKALVFKEP